MATPATPFPKLSLGGRVAPQGHVCLVIDSREQTPLTFTRLPTVRAGLVTGDYSLVGAEHLFSVERKSIPDLVNCCGGDRARFEKELIRMQGYHFRRLAIIGTREEILAGKFRGSMTPASILGSLATWEVRHGVGVCWFATPELAALQLETWAYYYSREILKVGAAVAAGCQPVSLPSRETGVPAIPDNPTA